MTDEELFDMLLDGRRRAQGRTRLMRWLDQQIAALRCVTDADIERVAQDTQKLIAITDMLLAHPIALHSYRDPTQYRKVQKKLADLKAELAAHCGEQR